MITKELLPAGSVVLLKESTRKLVIMGVLQARPDSLERVYDYCGCLYPEGYMDAEKIYLFDEEQIDKVFHYGYRDEEQEEFEKKLREILPEVKGYQ
ncbi:MAG: DUF4176 domain-containing protein [Blautia sp.]|nr:DUF4176 domain-containing protein [Blautia sp.]